jgi:hypothetical protein
MSRKAGVTSAISNAGVEHTKRDQRMPLLQNSFLEAPKILPYHDRYEAGFLNLLLLHRREAAQHMETTR